jgi:hypothetical protein
MSTGIRAEDQLEFMKLGAKTVFTKPASFGELIDDLKVVLSG